MEQKTKKIIFPDSETDSFRCPNCGEALEPADLETFHRCCYCNWQFEDTPQLEAFILSPVIRSWESNCQRNFPGE